MKLYTFLDEEEQMITQIRAENHDEAIGKDWNNNVNFFTDFYSETIKEDE